MKHVISLVSHQFIFTPSKDFFVSMTHYSVWREMEAACCYLPGGETQHNISRRGKMETALL